MDWTSALVGCLIGALCWTPFGILIMAMAISGKQTDTAMARGQEYDRQFEVTSEFQKINGKK